MKRKFQNASVFFIFFHQRFDSADSTTAVRFSAMSSPVTAAAETIDIAPCIPYLSRSFIYFA
ncbi:MAG: hypothetical protein WC726_02435 [Parcubacteria group bacterium]